MVWVNGQKWAKGKNNNRRGNKVEKSVYKHVEKPGLASRFVLP